MIQLVIAIALLLAGFAGGVKYHVGVVAQRDLEAQRARETDSKQQRQFGDIVATRHADELEALNDQLGDAYARIAKLRARSCLDPGTVRLLNTTGVHQPGGAAAGQPAGPAQAASAAGGGLRWASNINVGNYIAYCRTEYGKVSDQVNQILDIEDRRHPPTKDAVK